MREWMKKWKVEITILFIAAVISVLIMLSGQCNAETEYKELRVGDSLIQVTCEEYVENIFSLKPLRVVSICDTVIIRVVERMVIGEVARNESFDSVLCLQTTEAPRYECKKPIKAGVVYLDATLTCSHPECAPKPHKCCGGK